jgi:hypothetical protein
MRCVHGGKLADRAAQHNRGKSLYCERSTAANRFAIGCLDRRVPLCKGARGGSTSVVRTTPDAMRRGAPPAEISDSVRERPLPMSEEPMTTFDKREEGFEKQFAHDEELRFKANARRNKMLGLWAAQKLGLSGAEADEYAKAIVLADFEEPGEDDVFRKIRKDFDEKGITDSDHQIRRTMTELMAKAVLEIKAGR